MHTQPDFTEIDPEMFADATPPAEFIAEHFSVDELAELLNLTLDQLWLLVRDGVVPRPVYLPTNPVIACWNSDIIRAWIEAGAPRDPNHEAHKAIVVSKLIDALRNTLSANPPTLAERN